MYRLFKICVQPLSKINSNFKSKGNLDLIRNFLNHSISESICYGFWVTPIQGSDRII